MSEARRTRWIGMASADVVVEMGTQGGVVVPESVGLGLILRLLVSSSRGG